MAKDDKNDAPITRDELLTLVQTLVASNGLNADAVREIATRATIDAYDKTSGKFWDERNYPRISNFNPLGDKDNPRPELVGEVYWVGQRLAKDELTADEIRALNAIEPGVYGPDGTWIVRDLHPGIDRAKRKILVLFPCTDDTDRSRLPQGEWGGGKTGLEQMCERMTSGRALALA